VVKVFWSREYRETVMMRGKSAWCLPHIVIRNCTRPLPLSHALPSGFSRLLALVVNGILNRLLASSLTYRAGVNSSQRVAGMCTLADNCVTVMEAANE